MLSYRASDVLSNSRCLLWASLGCHSVIKALQWNIIETAKILFLFFRSLTIWSQSPFRRVHGRSCFWVLRPGKSKSSLEESNFFYCMDIVKSVKPTSLREGAGSLRGYAGMCGDSKFLLFRVVAKPPGKQYLHILPVSLVL